MKISGRKNDGAWYRTNKEIKKLNANDKSALTNWLLNKLQTDDIYFNAMLSLQSEAGITNQQFPTTVEMYIGLLIETGIPRQTWLGKLTFSTYTKVANPEFGEGGGEPEFRYVQNYASEAHAFGKELRHWMTIWLKARRQLRDIFQEGASDEGNPGGIADATPE